MQKGGRTSLLAVTKEREGAQHPAACAVLSEALCVSLLRKSQAKPCVALRPAAVRQPDACLGRPAQATDAKCARAHYPFTGIHDAFPSHHPPTFLFFFLYFATVLSRTENGGGRRWEIQGVSRRKWGGGWQMTLNM